VRGSLGLVIGLVVGAGGMYLALRPPWGGRGTAPHDAGVVVEYVPPDAGTSKPKKKRPHRNPAAPAGSDEPDEPEGPQMIALTGADRALEARGDDVALPRQTIDMAGGNARPLDDGEINAGVGQASAVRGCVVSGATNTDLRATITVQMVVDANGHVTKSRIEAPHYLIEHGLLACIQRALRGLHFPATGAPTLVTFPVNLG
jgi:hypothetical protein